MPIQVPFTLKFYRISGEVQCFSATNDKSPVKTVLSLPKRFFFWPGCTEENSVLCDHLRSFFVPVWTLTLHVFLHSFQQLILHCCSPGCGCRSHQGVVSSKHFSIRFDNSINIADVVKVNNLSKLSAKPNLFHISYITFTLSIIPKSL